LFLFFLAILILTSLFAKSQTASFFGVLTFLKIAYYAFYISQNVNKNNLKTLVFALTVGGVSQSAILFLQFISQGSIGGLFYFLGERTFSASTPGIATFPFSETLILRPYGTFPHPNVAAFFLFLVFALNLFTTDFKNKFQLLFQLGTLILLVIGLITTFSRIVILLTLSTFMVWIILNTRKVDVGFKKLILYFSILLLTTITFLLPRFGESLVRDILLRVDLVKISWEIFLASPFFGVGLNNFYYHEILYQKQISPTLLQPVHNIFLLLLSTTGALGLSIVLLFVLKTINYVKKSFFLSLLLASAIIVGIFDHYLVTLQQGQLLLGLVIGFCYSPLRKSKD
jgi:O-antigen ligase